MKAIYWDGDDMGMTYEEGEIPDDLKPLAEEYREKMIEEISDAFIALPGGMGTIEEIFEELGYPTTIWENVMGEEATAESFYLYELHLMSYDFWENQVWIFNSTADFGKFAYTLELFDYLYCYDDPDFEFDESDQTDDYEEDSFCVKESSDEEEDKNVKKDEAIFQVLKDLIIQSKPILPITSSIMN